MSRVLRILATAALAALCASTALAGWTGTTTTTDGVTVVSNPETPAFGATTQDLRELWRRGGEDDDVFFGTISEFLHDADGNIYLLDGQLSEIMVFDPAGELLRTLGRQGEGPGEFQNGADMYWGPKGQIGVVQAWPGKIVMLTRQGDPGQTFALPFRAGGGFQSVTRAAGRGENVVLSGTAWTRDDGKQIQFTYLKAYDAAGTELATFQETSRETQFGDYEFIEEEYVDFQRRWALAPDGRVAAALSFGDYRIHVWNADGTLDRIIERPAYKSVKRTAAEKERFQTMYTAFTRWNRGSTFRVNDNFDAIAQVSFRADGTLWVQSSQARWRAPAGVFTTFDVYDTVGRFVQRVALKAEANAAEDGLFFAGDRAFVVTDLFNAVMARMGGGSQEAADAGTEAEPVKVIAFEFAPVVASGK